MPISSLTSYLSTCDLFIAHWTTVNSTLPSELILTGSYGIDDLTSARAALQTAITAVETPRNQRQVAAGGRDSKKLVLREKLRQFRARVTGDFGGSDYAKTAPTMPPKTAGEGVFMKAMDDMASLWLAINAIPPAGLTPPLKLVGNYTQANLATANVALRQNYLDYNSYAQAVELAITSRDAMLPLIRARLVEYRATVPGRFAADDPLIASLPKVTPARGTTPKAVGFSGAWNAGTSKADFQWTASTNAELKEYQLRSCDPPKYRTAEEEVVATITKTDTTFSTDDGLLVSGSVKIFKIYVVTNDDNEKGSAAAKITRP